MAEPITNVLGTVAIKHCGEYDDTMHYEKLNVVTYNGGSYCAKTETQGNLPTNTTYWELMAEKGDKGDTGEDGYTPVKGTDYYTEVDKAELESTLSSDVANEVNEQLGNLTSATPLVASSVAEMIDTTRVYVNTTDGHWYWYDGDSWEDGGTYQSTGIADNSITPEYTNFYETYNILPKTGWIEGKVFDNSGNVTNYNTGCYNPNYVEVDNTQNLYMISNNEHSSKYMKIMQYDSSKNFLAYLDFSMENLSKTLNASCKYIRFTFWTEKFSEYPNNFPIVLPYNKYINLNSYYNLSRIKDEYNDKTKSKDIVINDKVHFASPIYTYNFTFNRTKSRYNEVNDVSIVGDTTGTTLYVGSYLLFKELSKNDTIYVFVESDKTPSSVTLMRTGDVAVLSLRKVTDNFYVGSVNDDVITYKDQLRCVARIDGATSGVEFSIRIKMNINSLSTTLDEYLRINNKKKNFIILGDSITHATGTNNWFSQLQSKINATLIANVAVDGATLKDYSDTDAYDGNPTDGSHNNVLGNQVQKILNNNYDEPDIIMIAIGTNGGISATDEEIYDTYYDSNQTLISVDNVDRKTAAGAFRWCNEKLHDKYPNAKIIWCTPIQGTSRNTQAIINWGDALKRLCAWGSNYCCDTEKCGISITNASEYLYDGLHPNESGAKIIGYYNASEIKKFFD